MSGPVEVGDPRLTRLEAEVERLRLASDGATTLTKRLPPVSAPPRASWVIERDLAQERARLERQRRVDEAAEAARQQAERDAPLQAKRDKEIAAHRIELESARADATAAQRRADRLYSELIDLQHKELR